MPGSDTERLKADIEQSSRCVASLAESVDRISAVCEAVLGCLRGGGKILTAGNGGSAVEALHMTEELLGRYKGDRESLASVCLSAEAATLTCVGNDFGFDHVFSRQVAGLGRPGDVLVLFSTSGRADNLRLALDEAATRGLRTVCVLGRDGGQLAGRGDVEIIVNADSTERIQEAHQVVVHLVLEAVERAYAGRAGI